MRRRLYWLFKEITRRKMMGAIAGYAVTAWVAVQAVSVVLPAFEAPNWILRYVITAFVALVPIVLILSWKYNLTPQGFVRTLSLDAASLNRKAATSRDLSALETIGKDPAGTKRANWADKQPRCVIYPPGTALVGLVRDLVGRSLTIDDSDADGERYAVVVDCLESASDIREAREVHLGRPLVAVVSKPDSPQAMAALAADVDGVISLTDSAATWRDCINVVLGGGRWFGGPGVEVSLDHKNATYEVARGADQSGEVTVRTRAFVRDFVKDRLQH
jgi:hypothetical protein